MKLIATLKNRFHNASIAAYASAEAKAATQSKREKRFNQLAAMLVLMMLATPAFAQGDEFAGFREAIEDFAGGDFAIGVSILSLVLGALMGLGKMTVWPALTGFAVAAVFAVGPYMIVQIFDWFSI